MDATRTIDLVPMIVLDTDTQMKVRAIRNEAGVRKWMYTDHLIGVNEHLGWIARLKQDTRQIVFVVMEEGKPLGVVSVNAIDWPQKRADWAYYLTETARGGLGSALEHAFLDFVFGELGLEKLNCEVIDGNDAVVKLHKKFLYQDEGFRRSNIEKNGARIGVHFLGLTKGDWISGRSAVLEKYQAALGKFSINIQWNPIDKPAPSPIDQIESARAKNNLNWMNILRLALEKSPETAKPIVDEIRRIDREISTLTDRLIE